MEEKKNPYNLYSKSAKIEPLKPWVDKDSVLTFGLSYAITYLALVCIVIHGLTHLGDPARESSIRMATEGGLFVFFALNLAALKDAARRNEWVSEDYEKLRNSFHAAASVIDRMSPEKLYHTLHYRAVNLQQAYQRETDILRGTLPQMDHLSQEEKDDPAVYNAKLDAWQKSLLASARKDIERCEKDFWEAASFIEVSHTFVEIFGAGGRKLSFKDFLTSPEKHFLKEPAERAS